MQNNIGSKYIPVTRFHIKDNMHVTDAAVMCTILSESKQFGHNPTIAKEHTDRNGRN